MISIKKLDFGGDDFVKKMLDNASLLGLNVIELLWIKDGSHPRKDVSVVVGFETPEIGSVDPMAESISPNGWKDDIVHFYPDEHFRAWGYIYDTPNNRERLASGLSSGWYRIVDKEVREEIIKLAEEKGYKTTITSTKEVNIRKTAREKEAEKRVKNLEDELEYLKNKLKEVTKQKEIVNNERMVHVEKRLEGTPVVNPEADKE